MVKTCRTSGERKTQRVNFLFKPSVYEAFQKVAHEQKVSPNSLIGELMEQYVTEHRQLVEQYDKGGCGV